MAFCSFHYNKLCQFSCAQSLSGLLDVLIAHNCYHADIVWAHTVRLRQGHTTSRCQMSYKLHAPLLKCTFMAQASHASACNANLLIKTAETLGEYLTLSMQAGSDVSASLTAWGSWQPALAPTRGPTVLDALIGSLGSRGSNRVSPCTMHFQCSSCESNKHINNS